MRFIILFMAFFYSLYAKEADAVLKIEKNVDNRAKISIIASSDTIKSKLKKINELFISDLRLSGHFLPDRNIQTLNYTTPALVLPTKSEYTLFYQLKRVNNQAVLDIKFYKGNPKKLLLRTNYSVSKLEKYPFLIHKAVSEINKAAGFPSVDWMNRYVVLSRYKGAKQTEIMLADYTFTYRKPIIKGGLNLFPKWADRAQKVLYYSNYNNKDNLLLNKVNIYSGAKSVVIKGKGMLACSDVSRDGSKLLLTMAPSSQPDIYLYQPGSLKRLTNFSGIDVGGKFANKEQNVVFVSNRLGNPNIYKMNIDGSNVVKIVHHGTNNGSVDAYDTQVIYSSKENSRTYNIYLTDINGEQTRPLTSGGINQFPRFSYDGKVLMYIKRTPSGNSIGFINISANIGEIFNLGIDRIQSIDW